MSKGAAAPKREEKGLTFPIDPKGERSTSILGRNVITAALKGAKTSQGDEYAAKCEKEKNWRFKYQVHYMNMVKASAINTAACLGIANAGLEFMHSNFDFIDPATKECTKFGEYMKANATGDKNKNFKTGTISGEAPAKESKPLVVPYKGKPLSKDALTGQLTKWSNYGTIESDAAFAVSAIAKMDDLNLSNEVFVLIGAGSAMGPYSKLLEHGATVVCIDIPSTLHPGAVTMWKRLFKIAKESKGKIVFPMSINSNDQSSYATEDDLLKVVGCNLTEQPAEICNWLLNMFPKQRLTVGNYTYLDSDLHVKLSLAADSILKILTEKRPNTNIAFLCTPTDIHVVTEEAHKAAVKNNGFHAGKLLETMIQVLSFGKMLRKNALPALKTDDPSLSLKIVDGLSVAQGPNYALAKRIQHWRCMVTYENKNYQGVVSTHVAPSTATLSVVSNKSFGWAYGGMPYFKPYEIFQQETTNALMASMLIYDVINENSGGRPSSRSKYNIKNPLEIFRLCSFHGGVWRSAYQVDSIGEVSVIIHFLGGPKLFLYVAYAILIGLASVAFFALKHFGVFHR